MIMPYSSHLATRNSRPWRNRSLWVAGVLYGALLGIGGPTVAAAQESKIKVETKPSSKKPVDLIAAPLIADPKSDFFKPTTFLFHRNGRREPFAPLLDPTPSVAATNPTADALKLTNLTLTGIIAGDANSVAIFAKQDGTHLRAHVGQTISDFTVTSIDNTGVRVRVQTPLGSPATLRLTVPRPDSLRKTP